MNLSEVGVELQQLAVYSTLKWILEKEKGLVVVLDETHRFAPQAGSNASKEMVTRYIKEGGAKGHFVVCTDRFAKVTYVHPSWLPEDIAVK